MNVCSRAKVPCNSSDKTKDHGETIAANQQHQVDVAVGEQALIFLKDMDI